VDLHLPLELQARAILGLDMGAADLGEEAPQLLAEQELLEQFLWNIIIKEQLIMKWQDKVINDIGDIKVTLASQHEVLKEHIARTELLETRLEPIEDGFLTLRAIQKILGFVAVLFAMLEAAKILNFF
jgi:hypothetical protein